MKVILLLSSLLFGFTMHCSDGDQKTFADQKTVGSRRAAIEKEYEAWQEKLRSAIYNDERSFIQQCIDQDVVTTYCPKKNLPALAYTFYNFSMYGRSPNIDLLTYMLASKKFDVEEASETGTALFYAIQVGNKEVAELLFKHGSKVTPKICNRFPYLFDPEQSTDQPNTKWFKAQIASRVSSDTIRYFKALESYPDEEILIRAGE